MSQGQLLEKHRVLSRDAIKRSKELDEVRLSVFYSLQFLARLADQLHKRKQSDEKLEPTLLFLQTSAILGTPGKRGIKSFGFLRIGLDFVSISVSGRFRVNDLLYSC